MQTDYTLSDEYREAVQVNEGTWLGLDLGRALEGVDVAGLIDKRQRQAFNWANPDERAIAEAQRAWILGESSALAAAQDAATTGTGAYILADAGMQYVSPAELHLRPTQAQLDYLAAKTKLQADKLKPRKPTQQDEQLAMNYNNGYEDGYAIGRVTLIRTACKITTGVMLAAMAAAVVVLLTWGI